MKRLKKRRQLLRFIKKDSHGTPHVVPEQILPDKILTQFFTFDYVAMTFYWCICWPAPALLPFSDRVWTQCHVWGRGDGGFQRRRLPAVFLRRGRQFSLARWRHRGYSKVSRRKQRKRHTLILCEKVLRGGAIPVSVMRSTLEGKAWPFLFKLMMTGMVTGTNSVPLGSSFLQDVAAIVGLESSLWSDAFSLSFSL